MHICGDWPCVLEWFDRNAAAIIALCALLVSIAVGLYTRFNARIAALPHLHTHQECVPGFAPATGGFHQITGHLVAKLINGGLGPAFVTRYEVFADETLVNLMDSVQAPLVVAKMFGLDPQDMHAKWYFVEGAIAIPKDGVLQALSLQFRVPNIADFNRVLAQIKRFRLRVEYQSLHGDELLFDSNEPALPPKLGLVFLKKR